MKWIKSYSQFLEESTAVKFYAGPDYDKPGNNQIVIFNHMDTYNVDGITHGLLSHAIKHFSEFKPEEMNRLLDDAIEYVKKTDNAILKSLNPNINLVNDRNLITKNTILNTFDLINDKILNSEQLSEQELDIKNYFLDELENKYSDLINDYFDEHKNVDELSLDEITQLVDKGMKIRFSCLYKGLNREYILNPIDTGIVSITNNDNVLTLFRIDKNGNDLKKVSRYFREFVIFNSELIKFFGTFQ